MPLSKVVTEPKRSTCNINDTWQLYIRRQTELKEGPVFVTILIENHPKKVPSLKQEHKKYLIKDL